MSIEMYNDPNIANTAEALNVGAVAIEQSRAIAEVKGQISIAKMFPRDLIKVRAAMIESCRHSHFAEEAFYSLPRGRESVTGPSIRFAEEMARCMGNFEYGHRELSRSEGKSEIEVYAWDKEQNNRSIRQITVEHVRDKSGGNVKLVYTRDIDDRIANVASKQVRGRILAITPKWIIAEAIAVCKETLSGGGEKPMNERVSIMVEKFEKMGVSAGMLGDYFKATLDKLTTSDLNEMFGIYGAINNGEKKELFFTDEEKTQELKDLQEQATKRGLKILEERRQSKDKNVTGQPVPDKGNAADLAEDTNIIEGETVKVDTRNERLTTSDNNVTNANAAQDSASNVESQVSDVKPAVTKGQKVRPAASTTEASEKVTKDTPKDDPKPVEKLSTTETLPQNENDVDKSSGSLSNGELSGNDLSGNDKDANMFGGDDVF